MLRIVFLPCRFAESPAPRPLPCLGETQLRLGASHSTLLWGQPPHALASSLQLRRAAAVQDAGLPGPKTCQHCACLPGAPPTAPRRRCSRSASSVQTPSPRPRRPACERSCYEACAARRRRRRSKRAALQRAPRRAAQWARVSAPRSCAGVGRAGALLPHAARSRAGWGRAWGVEAQSAQPPGGTPCAPGQSGTGRPSPPGVTACARPRTRS